jgi:DNA repair protein RadA/Sms
MSRPSSRFVCQGCGHQSPKWLGRCPACGEWESLVEEVLDAAPERASFPPSRPVPFNRVKPAARERLQTGIEELDRVMGGGMVPGSLVLIGGEPGIGKSTLLLQVSRECAGKGTRVLYVSGEESLEQIKLRGDRIGVRGGDLFLLAETQLERILEQAGEADPGVLILDSVQTVFSPQLTSGAGTISQVREVANRVFRFAKGRGIPAFLVGHITKDGALAGPKSLEHMVDVVLYFEGERDHSHRVLRALKNRFGPVSELALFEMEARGLRVIANPSAFFLRERPEDAAGSVVVSAFKGTRPLLVEVQALVSSTLFVGNPRRMSVGLDRNRVAMLLAVVEKKLGYGFGGEDVHLNVAGGLTIDEPAADLGVAAAVVSSLRGRPVPAKTMMMGEVGLSGEVRSVGQPLARIKEAASMGFNRVILPQGNREHVEREGPGGVDLFGVRCIKEALDVIF